MQNAILSAKTLLEKKKIIEQKKNKFVFIEVQDLGTFKFRVPQTDDLLDAREYRDGEYEDEFILYTCCVEPNLRDQELQEAFECKEPLDIIDAIFLPGEKTKVALRLVEASGFKDDAVKVIEEVKN